MTPLGRRAPEFMRAPQSSASPSPTTHPDPSTDKPLTTHSRPMTAPGPTMEFRTIDPSPPEPLQRGCCPPHLGTVYVMGRSRVPLSPIRETARMSDRPFLVVVLWRYNRSIAPSGSTGTGVRGDSVSKAMLSQRAVQHPHTAATTGVKRETRIHQRSLFRGAKITD
jgi:hypothetical protein